MASTATIRTSYYVKKRDRAGEHEGDMEGTTHAATGFLAGAGIGLLMHAGSHVAHAAALHNAGIDLLFGAVAGGLALLPDADHPKASFAYAAGWLSRGVSHLVTVLFGGHRQGMHSVFGVALFAVLAQCGAVWWPNHWARGFTIGVLAVCVAAGLIATGFMRHGFWALAAGAGVAFAAVLLVPGDLWWLVALGMGLHVAEDMCTGHGVGLAWPLTTRRYGGDGRQPAAKRSRDRREVRRPAKRPVTNRTRDPYRTGEYRPPLAVEQCLDCLTGDHEQCTDAGCKCQRPLHPNRPRGKRRYQSPPLPDEPDF